MATGDAGTRLSAAYRETFRTPVGVILHLPIYMKNVFPTYPQRNPHIDHTISVTQYATAAVVSIIIQYQHQ